MTLQKFILAWIIGFWAYALWNGWENFPHYEFLGFITLHWIIDRRTPKVKDVYFENLSPGARLSLAGKILFMSAGFEEVLLRLPLLLLYSEVTDAAWMVIALSSFIFGLTHWNVDYGLFEKNKKYSQYKLYYNLIKAVVTGLLGSFLGWIMIVSQSLFAAILVHAFWNFALYLIANRKTLIFRGQHGKVEDKNERSGFSLLCKNFESEGLASLKIKRLWVFAYECDENRGDLIIGARIGFFGKVAALYKYLMGGFDYRKDSFVFREFTAQEKAQIQKFVFNFCSYNGLKFQPSDLVAFTHGNDPHTLLFRLEPIENFFITVDKV